MYLLKGKLEVCQGGKVVATVEEGDALRIPAGELHQVRNPGPRRRDFLRCDHSSRELKVLKIPGLKAVSPP